MDRERIELDDGHVDVLRDGALIYLALHGTLSDAEAARVARHVTAWAIGLPVPTVRVWDASGLRPGGLQLTPSGTDHFAGDCSRASGMWPGTLTWLVADTPSLYGVCRIIETKATSLGGAVLVVHRIEELSPQIWRRIVRARG